jgi:hypothetical protein
MFTYRLLALLLLALAGPLTVSAAPPSQESGKSSGEADLLDAYPHSDAFAANVAWHKQVGKNEILMSWFLDGNPRVAMICTVNLSASKVTSYRDVYDWAIQATKTHELTHPQLLTLSKLVKNLPPSAKTPELKNLLLVSVVEKGQAKTYVYNRSALPQDAIRLCDITGAYPDPAP